MNPKRIICMEVELSGPGHALICALVQPTDVIDPAEVIAPDEVWAEVREAFPAEGADAESDVFVAPGGYPQ